MKKIVVLALLIGMMISFVILSGCSSQSAIPYNFAIRHNVTITSEGIPPWIAGQANAFQLEAQKGVPPYNWTVKPGSHLVNFVSLSQNGVISGIAPSQPENSIFQETPPFTVIVYDSDNPPSYDEKTYTIIMKNSQTPTPTPTPTPQPCPNGYVLAHTGESQCYPQCSQDTYCPNPDDVCCGTGCCPKGGVCVEGHCCPQGSVYCGGHCYTGGCVCSNGQCLGSSGGTSESTSEGTTNGSSTSVDPCSGCSSDYAIKVIYSAPRGYHGSWLSDVDYHSCSKGIFKGSSDQTIPIDCAKGKISVWFFEDNLQYGLDKDGQPIWYPITVQIIKNNGVVYQQIKNSYDIVYPIYLKI